MASAAVYSFQGVNELYGCENGSYWGSIGTYVTLMDDRAFWEQAGINWIEIYAPQSTEKNKPYRDAIDGDTEEIEKRLQSMTEAFIKDVKNSRPQLIDDGSVFKGKLYTAQEAKKIGAIDGIKSFDQVIQRAEVLARKYKRDKKKRNNSNQTEIVMAKDEKKSTFWGKIFGTDATAEDAEKQINEVQEEVKGLQSEVNTHKTTIQTQTEKIQKLENQAGEMQEDIEGYKNRIAELEKQNSEMSENLQSLEGTGFNSVKELADDHKKVIEHNKELGGAADNATPADNQQTVKGGKEEKNLKGKKKRLQQPY